MSGAPHSRYLVLPDEGDSGSLPGGVGVVFKVAGELAGQTVAVVEHPVPVGAFAGTHTHSKEDEVSYVLAGEIGVLIGTEEFVARAGAYVVKPRGIPHAFWNLGTGPARLLEILAPAGLEKFFRDMTELTTHWGAAAQLTARERTSAHGVMMHWDQAKALAARLGIPFTLPPLRGRGRADLIA